jgi:hypothetical protein
MFGGKGFQAEKKNFEISQILSRRQMGLDGERIDSIRKDLLKLRIDSFSSGHGIDKSICISNQYRHCFNLVTLFIISCSCP